ncbi:unnamed protein product, partial [marine sediment metagenome]
DLNQYENTETKHTNANAYLQTNSAVKTARLGRRGRP